MKPSSEDDPEVTTEQNFLNATHLQQTENNTEEDILEIKKESKLADDRSDESMTIIVVNDTLEEIEIQVCSPGPATYKGYFFKKFGVILQKLSFTFPEWGLFSKKCY